MFDMRELVKRHFEIILPDGKRVDVEPPKLKVLKRIMSIAKIDDEELDDSALTVLSEACAMALSKNKQGKNITADYLEEQLDIYQMQDLLGAYFDWVGEIQTSKN